MAAVALMAFGPTVGKAQDVHAADRTRITDSVHVFLTRYIAAYESRDLQAVMALYPTSG